MLLRLTKRTLRSDSVRLDGRNVGQAFLTSAPCRKLGTLTMFHNPNSGKSLKVLDFLQFVRTSPYPKTRKNANLLPLPFNLELQERIPTAEEFADMLYLLNAPSFTAFVDTTKHKAHPTSARALHELATKDPLVLSWPLVIDWERNAISVGNGMAESKPIRKLLREFVWERDGNKPAEPEPPRPAPPPRKPEWIDYD